jgi:hypothetical protein
MSDKIQFVGGKDTCFGRNTDGDSRLERRLTSINRADSFTRRKFSGVEILFDIADCARREGGKRAML